MKDLGNALLGIVLTIAGIVVFLQNITVQSFSLYHYNEVNVGGIIILLLAITLIAMLVKPNMLTGLLFGGTLLLFVIIMILSIQFHIKRMSALMLILIIGLICVGIALFIRGLIGINKQS